jgi:dihydrolipoamide dehydrogenase
MAVIGLGTIGLELGQSLSRLGVEITGFDQVDHIAGIQDPEVNQSAIDLLGKEFPIHLGAPAELAAEGDRLRVTAGEQSVLVDKVLCSIGRVPNVDSRTRKPRRGLGPARLPALRSQQHAGRRPSGLHRGRRLGIPPDPPRGRRRGQDRGLQRSAHRPTARHRSRFRRKVPLFINFCDPNICAVGTRWNALDPETTAVGQIKFAPVGRALIMGKNKGRPSRLRRTRRPAASSAAR